MFAVQKGTQIVGPILGFDPFLHGFLNDSTAAVVLQVVYVKYFRVKKKAPDRSPTFSFMKPQKAALQSFTSHGIGFV